MVRAMDADEKKLFVKILGQILIADGALSDAERDYLDRVLDSLGLEGDERKQALMGIDVDSPVEERVAALAPETRARLLDEARKALEADAQINPGEARIVDRIQAVLAGG